MKNGSEIVVAVPADVIAPKDIPHEKAVRRAEEENEVLASLRAARVRSILWQPRDRWAAWWTRQAINGDGGKYPGERKPPLARYVAAVQPTIENQLIAAHKLIVGGTPKVTP